ncbi:MAG: hypothetical protein QOG63_3083, partial [Thermoleophilaceae bacterium]|nr:hypothetical protein [Thermoleophilaceae bacterium]
PGRPGLAAGHGDARMLWSEHGSGLLETAGPLGSELPPPTTVGGAASAGSAVDAAGNALALDVSDDFPARLSARWRPAGASDFAAPVTLSERAGMPVAVIDGDGRGLAIFSERRPGGDGWDVRVVTCDASGCDGGQTISDPARPANQYAPSVAVSRSGVVAVAWGVGDGYPSGNQAGAAVRVDGSFDPPVAVSDEFSIAGLGLAVKDDGKMLLSWWNGSTVQAELVRPGGHAAAPELVPGVGNAYATGFDAHGRAVFAWTESETDIRRLRAVERLADGTWVGPQTVSDVHAPTIAFGTHVAYTQEPPTLAFDSAGGGLVTWLLRPDNRVFASDYDSSSVSAPARITRPLTKVTAAGLRIRFGLDRRTGARVTVARVKPDRTTATVARRSLHGRRGRNQVVVRRKLRAGSYRATVVARRRAARASRVTSFTIR